jgi:F0F1-type ATP synthase membrane subunit a
VLGWAIAYVALGLVAAALVLARREPTIVRGDWLFLLTALYILVAAVVTAARGGRFSLGDLASAVLVLVAGWLVQSRWWVVGAAPASVLATIEECASRLCAPAATSPGACTLTVPGGHVRVRLAPAMLASTLIVFEASTRHRKTELFRRLLAKQFRPVMPTIRLGDRSERTG